MANKMKASEYQTYPKYNVTIDAMSDDEIVSTFGLREMADVCRDLLKPYNGDILELQAGIWYIPWNNTCEELNRIFGFFGWDLTENSSQTVERVYTRNRKDGTSYEVRETYIETTARLEVRCLLNGSIVTKHVDNVGVAIVNTSNPNGIDTAVKGARSDVMSRCAKVLGIGLFLYEKVETSQPQTQETANTASTTAAAATTTTQQTQANNQRQTQTKEKIGPFTVGQAGWLFREHPDLTEDHIKNVHWQKVTPVMEALRAKSSTETICGILGVAAPQKQPVAATSRQPLF